MALTYSIKATISLGNKVAKLVSVTGDTSYPTGGYDVNADRTKLGLAILEALVPLGGLTSGGLGVVWDATNKKVKLYRYDYPAAAAGAAVEVPNATDVSAEKFDALVIGV